LQKTRSILKKSDSKIQFNDHVSFRGRSFVYSDEGKVAEEITEQPEEDGGLVPNNYCVNEGPLLMKNDNTGYFGEKWVRRWFILNEDGLWYYFSLDDIRRLTPMGFIGIIDIISVTSMTTETVKNLKYHKQIKDFKTKKNKTPEQLFTFSILKEDGSEMHLISSSEEIRQDWVTKLQELAAKKKNGKTGEKTQKEQETMKEETKEVIETDTPMGEILKKHLKETEENNSSSKFQSLS